MVDAVFTSAELGFMMPLTLNASRQASAGLNPVADLQDLQCSDPQPPREGRFRDIEIENMKESRVVYAMVSADKFAEQMVIEVAGTHYLLVHARRWPEVNGQHSELLLEIN